MNRRFVMCLVAQLACGSAAMASFGPDYEQQTPERPRRVQLPARSFLGVEMGEVNRETVQRLKLREERGALIEGVTTGSNAAQAGLQKDDVIVKWDGEPIESARELSRHIHETPAGRGVRLGVMRDGREIEINVKMGERSSLLNRVRVERPTPVARVRVRPDAQVLRPRVSERGHLGVQLQSMTPQLAEYFGLSKRTGALVVFVFADSPAAKAGLKAGDVILSAGGEAVNNPMDLRRVLTEKPQGSVEFKVVRDKQERTLTVQIEKSTGLWLLEPDDFDEAAPRLAIAPLKIQLPMMKIAPAAIAMPRIALSPMHVQVPKIRIAPLAMPRIALSPMHVQVPKITIAPLALPALKFDLSPMKVERPQIKIAPINVVIVPRRILL
ncbi:MAG: PDZ domain-containing protein [Acidobacteriota bacterium]